ncbi:hypothetical protein [Synechococcus sp. A15-28]|jgi:hypothetical protein|uniref:hypothetical protein n=1 Tax=Synechococcus sp. A15-28 TaxID=1050638 RepID=UPI000025ECC2|nr:hypothetical protein [Synechococcus sp. A15-28]MBA4734079.1 hypothetical protein [Synechococcus sp.]|tara:strand:+ start:946 stop:1242 length:297 start_codon:yes stop_codon:yes gene_type:complete
MKRMVWGMMLVLLPTAVLAESSFEWTETTSKECRSYFQQAYIDQARTLPPKGMGREYCGCVRDALITNPAAADVPRMCSLAVNSRFQTASQPVNTPDL